MFSPRSGQAPFVHQLLDLLSSESGIATPKILALHGLGSLAEVKGETHSLEHLEILLLCPHMYILSCFGARLTSPPSSA